jgi:hypothetical protein
MAEEMKRMRAQMEEDEQVASLMRGLRGQNLSDELFASADTQLRLVEVGLFPLHVAPWLPPSACYGQTIAMRFMCRGQIGLNREKIMNVFRNWKRKENEGKQEGISIWLTPLWLQVDGVEGEDGLPQVYDPETIAAYWGKRPGSVATRIAQLMGVAGGFLSRIAWDIVTKKVQEVGNRILLWFSLLCTWAWREYCHIVTCWGIHQIFEMHLALDSEEKLCFYLYLLQNEVKRAIELREIVTSLGPAYIKLGQALSIRPDILSPSAMTELQKLCDKVNATASLFL